MEPATSLQVQCQDLTGGTALKDDPETSGLDLSATSYVALVLSELTIGIGLALALQLAFAALLTVSRAVDLQAGYAFALIADPTNRSQMPLIGTLFAYAAAAIFFTTDGPTELLAILSLSIEKVPLGAALSGDSVAVLTALTNGRISRLAFVDWWFVLCGLLCFALGRASKRLPESILQWHRQAYRAWWRYKSRSRGGRPRISRELIGLIRRMSIENPLRDAPRIHGELCQLGFHLAQSTVSKYMAPRGSLPTEGWLTFLRNHADAIASIDVLMVSTVSF